MRRIEQIAYRIERTNGATHHEALLAARTAKLTPRKDDPHMRIPQTSDLAALVTLAQTRRNMSDEQLAEFARAKLGIPLAGSTLRTIRTYDHRKGRKFRDETIEAIAFLAGVTNTVAHIAADRQQAAGA